MVSALFSLGHSKIFRGRFHEFHGNTKAFYFPFVFISDQITRSVSQLCFLSTLTLDYKQSLKQSFAPLTGWHGLKCQTLKFLDRDRALFKQNAWQHIKYKVQQKVGSCIIEFKWVEWMRIWEQGERSIFPWKDFQIHFKSLFRNSLIFTWLR